LSCSAVKQNKVGVTLEQRKGFASQHHLVTFFHALIHLHYTDTQLSHKNIRDIIIYVLFVFTQHKISINKKVFKCMCFF